MSTSDLHMRVHIRAGTSVFSPAQEESLFKDMSSDTVTVTAGVEVFHNQGVRCRKIWLQLTKPA